MDGLQYFSPDRVAEMVGEENVNEMLCGYRTSLLEALNKLSNAFCGNQVEVIHHISHTMKSSSRFVGADVLASEFQKLEAATDNLTNVTQDTEFSISSINDQSKLLLDEINQYMNK
nr:Hpt domain-containing protein [Vibrio anguillarum]